MKQRGGGCHYICSLRALNRLRGVSSKTGTSVCVCVCERERERERGLSLNVHNSSLEGAK